MIHNRKKIIFTLRLFLLFLSIVVLVKIVDFKLVLSQINSISFYVVISLVMIGIVRTWLSGLRWRLLNPDLTGQLSSWHYFRFVMIAHTFNLIMPGALGGDFVKTAFTLKTVKHKHIDNVIAILVDRFIGLLSILVLGTAAFYFMSDIPNRMAFNTFWVVLYSAILILLVLMLSSRLHRFLKRSSSRLGKAGAWLNRVINNWQDSLQYFLANRKKVVLALLLCLPIHTVSFVSAYIIARSLNINISFFDITLIISIVWVVTAIPITLSGVGVRELSMVYFMSLYGINPASATALSIYLYIITLFLGFLGLLFIFDFSKLPGKKNLRTKRDVDFSL